jgi:ABC-type transport system substrate-binding protein
MNHALAQQSSDPTAANALWESVDRRLADAAPAVPLFNRQHVTLVSARVDNVQHHPLWGRAVRPALGEVEIPLRGELPSASATACV